MHDYDGYTGEDTRGAHERIHDARYITQERIHEVHIQERIQRRTGEDTDI